MTKENEQIDCDHDWIINRFSNASGPAPLEHWFCRKCAEFRMVSTNVHRG